MLSPYFTWLKRFRGVSGWGNSNFPGIFGRFIIPLIGWVCPVKKMAHMPEKSTGIPASATPLLSYTKWHDRHYSRLMPLCREKLLFLYYLSTIFLLSGLIFKFPTKVSCCAVNIKWILQTMSKLDFKEGMCRTSEKQTKLPSKYKHTLPNEIKQKWSHRKWMVLRQSRWRILHKLTYYSKSVLTNSITT